MTYKCAICGKEYDNLKSYLKCVETCAKNIEAKEAEEARRKNEQESNKRMNRIIELCNELKPLIAEEQKATGATEESIFKKHGIDLSALSEIIPSTIGFVLDGRPFYYICCICKSPIIYRDEQGMCVCSGCGVERPDLPRPMPKVAGFDSIRPKGGYSGKEKEAKGARFLGNKLEPRKNMG